MAGSGGTKEPAPQNLDNTLSEKLPKKSILKSEVVAKPTELDLKRVLDLCSKPADQIASQEEHIEALRQMVMRLSIRDLANIRGLKKILSFDVVLDA